MMISQNSKRKSTKNEGKRQKYSQLVPKKEEKGLSHAIIFPSFPAVFPLDLIGRVRGRADR